VALGESKERQTRHLSPPPRIFGKKLKRGMCKILILKIKKKKKLILMS
jgi:hypothetical protein